MPATEEQRCHQRGNGDDADNTPHEEQTEFHTGIIFDIGGIDSSSCKLRLVKRVTVTDRYARDGESKPKICGITFHRCARLRD